MFLNFWMLTNVYLTIKKYLKLLRLLFWQMIKFNMALDV